MNIAMLLSGGVDSSVALSLIKKQGHTVTAYYLKIWLEDEAAFLGDCPWEEDLEYARGVCGVLDVPLEIMPLQREYYDKVVSYTVAELKAGRTPSPDLFCNKFIKFGVFWDTVAEQYDMVASGHYARILRKDDTVYLQTAVDPVKDQTYFLSRMTQEQLARAVFPIGGMQKHDVREAAAEANLPTESRRDSQGICFLGKIKFRDFAKIYLGEKEGEIIEQESGRVLGIHKGYWLYTIGQRQGLGLSGGPWFVVAKDLEKNRVIVSHQMSETPRERDSFTVEDCNWITTSPPPETHLRCKLRHGPEFIPCTLALDASGLSGAVKLAESDAGIASGQFAVLYADDICLGSGRIG